MRNFWRYFGNDYKEKLLEKFQKEVVPWRTYMFCRDFIYTKKFDKEELFLLGAAKV